jgi:hypothetical protein
VNKVAYRSWSTCASTVRSSRWWAHKVVNPSDGVSLQKQLPRRGESALFAEHLQEARGVVAELALGGLVDGHHGPMELPLGLVHLCLPQLPCTLSGLLVPRKHCRTEIMDVKD